ncbi:hypothetical protein EVAR_583_1 [Eumeta japonica]|uniref:Uncharacterized protein n=1 Tax=Eumeta variegata TaxID=151549 RepID=A0A4C1SDS2_EUMVA|nr:hypothetical protein EVAR_583_1 [Eumeta japonica]
MVGIEISNSTEIRIENRIRLEIGTRIEVYSARDRVRNRNRKQHRDRIRDRDQNRSLLSSRPDSKSKAALRSDSRSGPESKSTQLETGFEIESSTAIGFEIGTRIEVYSARDRVRNRNRKQHCDRIRDRDQNRSLLKLRPDSKSKAVLRSDSRSGPESKSTQLETGFETESSTAIGFEIGTRIDVYSARDRFRNRKQLDQVQPKTGRREMTRAATGVPKTQFNFVHLKSRVVSKLVFCVICTKRDRRPQTAGACSIDTRRAGARPATTGTRPIQKA